MNRVAVLLVLLLAPTTAAQVAGPAVVPVVHHPYPDDADPLGMDFARGRDAFWIRHGQLPTFADGVAYPAAVFDGVLAVEGLPAGDPYDATLAAYNDAFANRRDMPAAAVLSVTTRLLDDAIRVRITVETGQFAGLNLWASVVEHTVRYQPPSALSNGVFDHPFTSRNTTLLGPAEAVWEGTLARDPTWDGDKLWLAIWLEHDGDALRGQPGEVIQAAFHPASSSLTTRQEEKAVLMEMLSASWCEPCLFGDRAIEAIAAQHGIATSGSGDGGPRYWQGPPVWLWPVLLAVFAAVAMRKEAS